MRRPAGAHIVMAVIVLFAFRAAAEEPPKPEPAPAPPPPPGPTVEETAREVAEFAKKHGDANAALHYLEAMLQLAALPKADGEVETFVETTLLSAPPAILAEYPQAGAWLRSCLRPVTLRMRRGAGMKRCRFDLDWDKGAGILMPHLSRMRGLARTAVACGKWYEFRRRPAEAARIYLDVCRMGVHLHDEPIIISDLVGMAVMGMGLRALQGMLARGVDAETGKLVLDGLRSLPAKPFSIAEAVDAERIIMGGWARLEFAKATGKGRGEVLKLLAQMMGRELKWHERLLVPIDTKKLMAMVDRGHAVYDAHAKEVVAAMRKPFAEGKAELAILNDKDRIMQRAKARKVGIAGILISMTAPSYGRSKVQEARTEALLRATTILAAAARAKAKRGKYPVKLDQLAEHFGDADKMPKDPFTGEEFSYKLDGNGLPVVETPGDDPGAEPAVRERLYIFSFSAVRGAENRALDAWRVKRGIPGLPAAPPIEDEEVF